MDAIADLRAHLAPLLGKVAWRVALGYSTFITLEFGEPRESNDRTHGAWHLWVYGADWRLEDRDTILAGSSDDRERQAAAVQRLEGLALHGIDVRPPALDTTLIFDDDVVLRLFATYSEGLDHWMLFVPDGYVLMVVPAHQLVLSTEFRALGRAQAAD